ncbi:NUDIX hydrolase [Clostridium botulinum]|uniref:NUDIX hydrolase n=1 Tax=Clostridium botulinum TaxID=1491 RepID=UPI000774A698|nr:NUDIX domain-containing protein [Clostridium botulinum]NFE94581.1 NUDIX domain-containing protein [Clostridium botulinum]NFL39116.1 NUDIX domain-containing protein [Clostridium botulinum]NFL66439.1 NUDIX domain-containing protein [Clostridium botulinum]NFN08396.1 NUDIX domain-containing protein [Clostridium botulinum]NFN24838.1 NUDIX domain-containing protein [Clostridium botulinum]
MKQMTFGERLKDKKYTDRIGAYALIFHNDKIAVIKLPGGYFLPGGGVEKGENNEECLNRECMEELGCTINIKEFVCVGSSYHWGRRFNGYIHSIGNFYLADSLKKVGNPTEKDHELVWLTIDEACDKMFLSHQAWAIKEGVAFKKKLCKK